MSRLLDDIKIASEQKQIIDSDKIQKKIPESKIEIERIIRLCYNYSNNYNYRFDQSLHFIMISAGYAKDNCEYVANPKELEIITSLCLQYMQKYNYTMEFFMYKIHSELDAIRVSGYSSDIRQKTIFDLRFDR